MKRFPFRSQIAGGGADTASKPLRIIGVEPVHIPGTELSQPATSSRVRFVSGLRAGSVTLSLDWPLLSELRREARAQKIEASDWEIVRHASVSWTRQEGAALLEESAPAGKQRLLALDTSRGPRSPQARSLLEGFQPLKGG